MAKSNGAVPRRLQCERCKKTLPVSKFGVHTAAKYQLRSSCKKCWSKFIQSYKKSPKGRIATKATNQRWAAKHKKEKTSAAADK